MRFTSAVIAAVMGLCLLSTTASASTTADYFAVPHEIFDSRPVETTAIVFGVASCVAPSPLDGVIAGSPLRGWFPTVAR